MTSSRPSAQKFKYKDTLDELKTYDALKNHIRDLLKRNYSPEKNKFLESLQNLTESIIDFDSLKQAMKLFYHWHDLEAQLDAIDQERKQNTLLNEFTRPEYNDIEAKLASYKKYLEFPQFRYGKSAQYKADIVYKVIANYQQRAADVDAIKSCYPASYKKMIELSQKTSHEFLNQITILFRDYNKKTPYRLFHWRAHGKEAELIHTKLTEIVMSEKSDDAKIDKALALILAEKNRVAQQEKLSLNGQKEHSFCRRALFAIELLDSERRRLQSSQIQLKLS